MKRVITITSMLLVALTVSCRKPGATGEPAADTDAKDKIVKAQKLQKLIDTIDNASESGDKERLAAALKAAIMDPGAPPKRTESWAARLARTQEEIGFAKITKLVVEGKVQAAIDELDVFIKEHPENKPARLVREGLKKKMAMDLLRKEAYALFEEEEWDKALPLLEELRICVRGDRKLKEMIRECTYRLELIAFNRAAAANSYEEARVSAEKARDIYPDGYDRDIEPKLLNMEAKRKISAILAKGAEALKNAQYSNVRRILDHLKGSYPEAAEMIRQSRYRENLAKGRAAQKKGDLKTAWALYKTAKAYAKTRAEHKQIDALIIAAAAGL